MSETRETFLRNLRYQINDRSLNPMIALELAYDESLAAAERQIGELRAERENFQLLFLNAMNIAALQGSPTLDQCQTWLEAVCEQASRAEKSESENASLRADLDLAKSLESSQSPCGHYARYSHTEDGGKHIECFVCENASLRQRVGELEKALDRYKQAGVRFCECGHLNMEHYGAADWQTNPDCDYLCSMNDCSCKKFRAESALSPSGVPAETPTIQEMCGSIDFGTKYDPQDSPADGRKGEPR